MKQNTSSEPAPGWVGGFAESNPAFAYPNPDLSSLPVLDNLDNIPKIQRQQAVYWPEFNWKTVMGKPDSRCFQRFAHDISRLGYDDIGRVWSIICPQQGVEIPDIAWMNVEVTVTGQRGWANETNKQMAADMGVVGKIWFSPSSLDNWFVKKAWKLFKSQSLPFPSDKENAIKVTTHAVGDPNHHLFELRSGENPKITSPDFARHEGEAWDVSYLSVEIGPIEKTNHEIVDTFNQKVLDIFNLGSGNMLKAGNVLTWNVWFTAPELVDTEEWKTHAERWRKSIHADHGKSPDGSVSGPVRYADGSPFKPLKYLEAQMEKKLVEGLVDELKVSKGDTKEEPKECLDEHLNSFLSTLF